MVTDTSLIILNDAQPAEEGNHRKEGVVDVEMKEVAINFNQNHVNKIRED